MSKLTPDQTLLLDQLAAADLDYRDSLLNARERIERAVQKEVEAKHIARDIIAYRVDQAGVSRTQIAKRGLRTTATITAREAIKNGAQYASPVTVEDEAEKTPRFSWLKPGKVIRFTPDLVEFEPYLPTIGHTAESLAQTPALLHADVKIKDGHLETITEGFTDELGMHPVVSMVDGPNPKWRAEMKEWAA